MGTRVLPLAGTVIALVMASAAPAMARESRGVAEHMLNYDRMLLERDGAASIAMGFSVRFGGDRDEDRAPTWSFGIARETSAQRQRFEVLSYRFEEQARIEAPLRFRGEGAQAWRGAAAGARKPLIGIPAPLDGALAPAF